MRATSTRRDAYGWWLTKDVALSAGEWGASLLGAGLRHSGARLRHEAAWCLACIGAVICARQEKLERLWAPLLWGSFATGLSAYAAARQRVFD